MSQVSAIRVKNHVRWINPNFRSPFLFEKGKQSPLGLLLSLHKSEKPDFFLTARLGHMRSAVVGNIITEDCVGRRYRWIDVKGSGFVKNLMNGITPFVSGWRVHTDEDGAPRGDVLGLLDFSSAYHDAMHAEAFARFGIGTHRVLAIIALDELNVGIERIPIEECKKQCLLDNSFEPVIAVRAFPTLHRLSDVAGYNGYENDETVRHLFLEMIRDAWPKSFSYSEARLLVPDYLAWLAETVGYHVGRMHKHKRLHRWLNPHNILLDGSLVDLDGVERMGVFNRLGFNGGKFSDMRREIRRDVYVDCFWHGNGDEGSWHFTDSSGAIESLLLFRERCQKFFPAISDELRRINIAAIALQHYEKAGGRRLNELYELFHIH